MVRSRVEKKIRRNKRTVVVFALLVALLISVAFFMQSNSAQFPYQKASLQNPMRGLIYWGGSEHPHSLTYVVIPFTTLFEGNDFTTEKFDKLLNDRAARFGNQAVVRFFIAYPGDVSATNDELYLPQYIKDSLQSRDKIYTTYSSQGYPKRFTDFGDEYLLLEIFKAVKILGEKFDGDPRIAFWQLGLLGQWGEWNYGAHGDKQTLTKEKYNQVYQNFQDSFKVTKLMARNPTLGDAANFDIGFHDDNFLYNTIKVDENNPDDIYDQFYQFMLKTDTQEKWKTQVYGGEQSGAGPDKYHNKTFWQGTDLLRFKKSMEVFHFSWMSLFLPEKGSADYEKALEYTRLMGYEFFLKSAMVKQNGKQVKITISNTGNAPFYYNWEGQLRLKDKDGNVAYMQNYSGANFIINDIMPGQSKEFSFKFDTSLVEKGAYTIEFSILSPMQQYAGENFKPFFFANKSFTDGFVELSKVKI